ncbi:ATP-binding protein [Mycolicibacterium helvum]|nr:LuxR family transcriptional regulator [Mycolicibacterium helvum]
MIVNSDGRATPLLGRHREQKTLADLLDSIRQGRSGVLVIRGEPGIGKTALLDDALRKAVGIRTIHITGAESEMELPYAGLQQVCDHLTEFYGKLTDLQERALSVALGTVEGDLPDRLMLGMALLTLLSAAGADRPTLCVVDDAQWVDSVSMQALAFVARRTLADSVALVFAVRDGGSGSELAGQPEMTLQGLDDHDAHKLLATMVLGRVDEMVRANIVAEAGGNPLALMEFHKASRPQELAGGYGLANAKPLTARIERTFGRRLRELPPETRMLLLIAAVEPAGRAEWVWAAARLLGIGVEAARPAEQADLITVDEGIRFRHPLIRAALYGDASVSDRRRVHAALAQAVVGTVADECRAWHRAHAAGEPDEGLAEELVRAAEAARVRGGAAAAASFLACAVNLSADPNRRAERALDAAQAKLDAGAPEAASALLAMARDVLVDDEFLSARDELLRAKLAFAASRGNDAPPLLLRAAKRLEHHDRSLSRETYLEAVMASVLVGGLAIKPQSSTAAVAAAAQSAPASTTPVRAIDLLLDGLVVRLTDGYIAAAPLLKNAISELLREEEAGIADPRWHDITHRVCLDLFDQDSYNFLVLRQAEELRAAGALTLLPVTLVTEAGLCVTSGEFERAQSLLAEAEAIITATGGTVAQSSIDCYLAAYRGQEQVCRELVDLTIDRAKAHGQGFEVATSLYASAILFNGLGRYADALAAATAGANYDDIGICGYLLCELIEAATRCGEHVVAGDALRLLVARAEASGTATALGMAARSTALTNEGSVADAAYRDAIEHLERSPVTLYLARTHLVYGEWLRREKRKADARQELQTAHDMFDKIGADTFAARARRELNAAGFTVYTRAAGAAVALTTQESSIARLAREGFTNPEIGAQLFLSPRTVEWHLARVFAKLSVTSRRELRNVAF